MLDPTQTVATIARHSVTVADLDKSIDDDLRKTTDEYVEKVHDFLEQGLDALLAERLVDMEAKATKLSTDDLLKKEVQLKVPTPSDADVQA